MRIIIAGSRICKDESLIEEIILAGIQELGTPSVILHGGAEGVDKLSGKICKKLGYNVVVYNADWKDIKGKDPKHIKQNKFGKYYCLAGFDRNQKMADNADALISINFGTNGTDDMESRARKAGLKIYKYQPDDEECFGFNFWDE